MVVENVDDVSLFSLFILFLCRFSFCLVFIFSWSAFPFAPRSLSHCPVDADGKGGLSDRVGEREVGVGGGCWEATCIIVLISFHVHFLSMGWSFRLGVGNPFFLFCTGYFLIFLKWVFVYHLLSPAYATAVN